MRRTVVAADGRDMEVVIGDPGDVERFIEAEGLFGGNASNYVTLRYEVSRYRDADGGTYWVMLDRDSNKRVSTAVHEAVVMAACEGGVTDAWWPAGTLDPATQ